MPPNAGWYGANAAGAAPETNSSPPIDVKARRLDLTKAAVREAIVAGELDAFRGVVEALASEFDPLDVAAAATRLAHEATSGGAGDEDDVHIPHWEPFRRREQPARPPMPDRPPMEGRRGPDFARRDVEHGPGDGGDMVRIFVGAGRNARLRPADLVGAIANEAGIDARGIGAIDIADTFSIVELRERDVERVLTALQGATFRGRTVEVRRDRQAGDLAPSERRPFPKKAHRDAEHGSKPAKRPGKKPRAD